jgi:putative transposase
MMSTSIMTTQKTKAFHRLAVMLLLKILCFASGLWRDFKQLLGTRNRMANAHRFYQINKQSTARQRCKPDWVCKQVLRLKAHMPRGTGVSKIAQTFNRSQAGKSKMTISKTYVANTIRANQYQIQSLRTEVRTRARKRTSSNHIWGIDMTGKCDAQGVLHNILGIIDHGSRRLLSLTVCTKHSLVLAKGFFAALPNCGIPRQLRTDNERCFTSKVFTTAIATVGTNVQHIERSCPWQNGRIERLFGTLKQKLNKIAFADAAALQSLLHEFMVWYNEIRPHQHLQGATPTAAWHRIDYNKDRPRSMEWWSGWGGQLCGPRLRW